MTKQSDILRFHVREHNRLSAERKRLIATGVDPGKLLKPLNPLRVIKCN